MTRRKDKGSGDYEVGYGKPPRHAQWKRGESGNPRGRPKGARANHLQLLAHLQPTRDIILEEAYAPVTVRDGDRSVQMPAIRAVTRATIKSAVTGGQMAQRTMLELTQRTEDAAAELNRELFERLYRHKLEGGRELQRCRAAGLPEPQLLPHPDDMVIDWVTLTVNVRGPWTAEQQRALDQLIANRDEYERGFNCLRAEAKAKPRDWMVPLFAKEAQYLFDYANDHLPERCRKRLVGRMSQDEIDAAEARARTKLAARRGRAGGRRRRA